MEQIRKKSIKPYFLFCVFICLTVSSQGNWTQLQRDFVANNPMPATDGFQSSLWRAANMPWLMVSDFPDLKIERFAFKIANEFPVEGSTSSYWIRVGLRLQKDTDGQILKRPAVFLLPGIFADVNNLTSLMQADWLFQKGYHVFLFSNPWSKNWIVDIKSFVPGDLDSEVIWMDRFLAHIRTQYADKIENVSVLGNSYGAFLGARWVAKSKETFAKVYLVNPPADLLKSVARLDKHADETFEVVKDKLSIMWEGLYYLQREPFAGFKEKSPLHAKAVVIYGGFIEDLARSLLTMGYRDRVTIEPPGLDNRARKHWLRSFRFRDYASKFSNLEEIEKQSALEQWVNKASAKSSVYILTAEDDFLNEPQQWDWKDKTNILIAPEGGHMGYILEPWYKALFLEIF